MGEIIKERENTAQHDNDSTSYCIELHVSFM